MRVKLRWRKLKSGKESAYLDIHYEGKRWHEALSIQIDSKRKDANKVKIAEEARTLREVQLLDDMHGSTHFKKELKKADFMIYFNDFIEKYPKKGTRKYISAYNCLKKFTQNKRVEFRDLNKNFCIEFRDYLEGSSNNFRGETPFDYFSRFKQVLNRAIEAGYLESNPALGVKISRKQNELVKEVLTIEELKLLAQDDFNGDDVKRAFLFSCNTGLGYAEIIKLTSKNIIDGDLLSIRRAKTGEYLSLPLSSNAKKILSQRSNLKDNEPLFKLPSDTAVRLKLKAWMKDVGIEKNISYYCARHTFAMILLGHSKADPFTLYNMMGTTSVQHTMKYLKRLDPLKIEAAKKFPEFF